MTEKELERIERSTNDAKDEDDLSVMDYELLDAFATFADIARQLTRIADELKESNRIAIHKAEAEGV